MLEELVELGACSRELDSHAGFRPAVRPSPNSAATPMSRPAARSASPLHLPPARSRRQNRNSTFVNGRLIRDRLLLHAISYAYHNLMPHSCYPFALLFLECDCEEVDVNVHPSKTEVRFRHGSFVHDFIRDTLRDRLIETRPAPAFTVSSAPQPAPALPFSEFTQMLEDQAQQAGQDTLPPTPDSAAPLFTLRPEPSPPRRLDFGTGGLAVGREHQRPRNPRRP